MDTDARRQEYEFIRDEQARLRRQMARLEQRIETLLADEPAEAPEASASLLSTSTPPPLTAESAPPLIPVVQMPPPLPVGGPTLLPPPEAVPAFQAAPSQAVPPSPTPTPTGGEGWEVQIGTTWLVRVGVVLLLTSLAFLGSYLYKHIVPLLGVGTKVLLLYLGAGTLMGVGAWLERRSERGDETGTPHGESLRQYARVVLAGGLAAVYYVTYAVHWNPRLQVIANPILAGALLLGWTAFMVFLADSRKSETLATFAILLAYYTSAINEIGGFTLFANLALTLAAVFLLRRHLWTIFPFASLLATFGSYGFWRYFHVYAAWSGRETFTPSAIHAGGFWIDGTFLAIYWLLFTWVVFTASDKHLTSTRRATFAGVNNGAFFALSTWALLADYPGSFWKWALGFGAVLLALAETGRRWRHPLDARTQGTYQTGGLLLVTWGLVSYFSGWHLSLALAVESAVLLVAAGRRASRLLLAAAGVVAFMALLWALDWLDARPTLDPWAAGAAVGGFLVFNAWWSLRLRERPAPTGNEASHWEELRAALALAPAYFSLLGCVVWFSVIERQVPTEVLRGPSLVLAAVLLTAAVHFLRIGALAFYAQGYLLAALLFWLENHAFLMPSGIAPVWNPLVMVGGTLAVGHWWQQRRWAVFLPPDHWNLVEKSTADTEMPPGREAFLPGRWNFVAMADAVFIVSILAVWLHPRNPEGNEVWVAESAALALLIFGYGLFTRYSSLALAGQYFQVASIVAFCRLYRHGWNGGVTEPLVTLAPILGSLAVLAVGSRLTAAADPTPPRQTLLLTLLYEAEAVGLIVAWGSRFFPHLEKFSLFCLVGGMVFALGVWRSKVRWLLWSGVPLAAGLITYFGFYDQNEQGSLVQWLGIALLAALQRFGRRKLPAEIFPHTTQSALIIVATLVGWRWVSAWVGELAAEETFTLAGGWSLFAALVFAAGFVWRESTYRWMGLVILAGTLGRIVLYDIWQLDSLGRILSSFALGLVLLGIAFVYVRFQKQLKNWF